MTTIGAMPVFRRERRPCMLSGSSSSCRFPCFVYAGIGAQTHEQDHDFPANFPQTTPRLCCAVPRRPGETAPDNTLGLSTVSLLEQLGVGAFATVMQLPFHIALALPWLVAAWGLAVILRRRVSQRVRLTSVSGVIAIGLAPVYGAHLSMVPAYLLIFSGSPEPLMLALSFFVTWGVVLLVTLAVSGRASRKQLPEGQA